jgi:CheY-like chemotaxis protein
VRLQRTLREIARSRGAHARTAFDEPHWYMPSHKQRVLIVEDDPEIQAALEELMEGEGYDVTLAANGAEAIEMLESGHPRPDVALVDLLMPGVVGQELLEYLRGEGDLAKIPVAIVSASPQLAPAGYPVFKKPLDLPPLLEFIKQAGA